jgi:hypothetical protein
MTKAAAATSRSLLLHDGELSDVRALLVLLKVPFVERLGAERDEDRTARWDLVIASAKRILELQLPVSSSPPSQIAILAHDARTLRSSLRRTGTTLMVRRPVHPAVLRALIVHALYRGPEKRRSARVNVGAPVRWKTGWRHRQAILVDLSVSGCRLITDRAIEPGRRFRLDFPAPVAGGRGLALEANVVQCTPSTDPALVGYVTTASFVPLSARQHSHLHAAVAAHAEGPAVCADAPRITVAPADAAGAPHAASSPNQNPKRSLFEPADTEPSDDPLEAESARVLVGRDLSRGGMRVDANLLLLAGMKLRLAVHAETREMPLLLNAVVDRDDGERGLVLRFCDVSAELGRYLDYVIHALPLVIDDDDDEGCLVTELLEIG